jgi:hypothetical protein
MMWNSNHGINWRISFTEYAYPNRHSQFFLLEFVAVLIGVAMSAAIKIYYYYYYFNLLKLSFSFVDAFAKLGKGAIASSCLSMRPSVRPFVRMEQRGSHWTDFREI